LGIFTGAASFQQVQKILGDFEIPAEQCVPVLFFYTAFRNDELPLGVMETQRAPPLEFKFSIVIVQIQA
jgi:hypothetical protein